MNMDTITLKFQSVLSKMKSDLSDVISKYEKLDNTMNKTANNFNKMTNNASNIGNSFKGSKQQLEDLDKELKDLTSTYNTYSKVFKKDRIATGVATYNPTLGTDKFDPKAVVFITQETLDEQKARIDELEQKIEELRGKTEEPIKQPEVPQQKLVPKTSDAHKGVENIGKKADESSKKISRLASVMKSLGSISKYVGSKGFDFLKNKFSDFTKRFGKKADENFKKIKKLALGLIGVRTAMSVLTKSVNAYLSFDSELQDSLTNSWNTLGALLAPAIELVASLFAMATTYVAQFVSALTGIDLVARANAKALETQAKANQKANKAQRGLLAMDEITNLPTENEVTPASQIQIDDTIKSFKLLDDLLSHLQGGKWHLVGEDIAHGINDLLSKIKWKELKEKAYNLGYNFGDFLNGLFEVNWSQIGNTLAESFNTYVQLIKGFVDKFSFIQFGKGAANTISSTFLDINWIDLANTINRGIQGVGDGISTFLSTFKWGDIGKAFGEFVRNIDWGNLIFQAFKISVLAIIGLAKFLINFFYSAFGETFVEIGYAIGDWISDSIDNFRNILMNFFLWLDQASAKFGNAVSHYFITGLNYIIDALNMITTPIRALIVGVGKVTGQNWTMENIRIPHLKVPPLETGTPNIETEGLYHLHEGEMVVPKRYNPNTDGYNSGADNRQIIDLLISLNSSMLEYAERPIEIKMDGKKVAEGTYDSLQEIDKNRNQSATVVRS